MPRTIVSDTGPIITLEKLPGGFDLLRKLYDQIQIPQQVATELADGFEDSTTYLDHFGIADFCQIVAVEVPKSDSELATLDSGEQAAIVLAQNNGLPLLIEERAGRQVAKSRSLQFSGIAGQVLKAFRVELLSRAEAEEMLRDLYEANRINRRLFVALVESLR